jgi:hypothetical protein
MEVAWTIIEEVYDNFLIGAYPVDMVEFPTTLAKGGSC